MAINHELNIRAGKIADAATGILSSAGIYDALVRVTYGPWTRHPLSVRTPKNDGFGSDSWQVYKLYQELENEAINQAEYQLTVGGRTASQQWEKLAPLHRTAAAYNVYFPDSMPANFAFDPKSKLTVVVTAKTVSNEDLVRTAEGAIVEADNENFFPKLEAKKFMDISLARLLSDLPEDRTGYALLTSPVIQRNEKGEMLPSLFYAQSVGQVVEPNTYAIVAAKAKSTAVSRLPSEKGSFVLWPDRSNIQGAIPVDIKGYGERIIAAGGLPSGEADVNVILGALQEWRPAMAYTILEQLSHWH